MKKENTGGLGCIAFLVIGEIIRTLVTLSIYQDELGSFEWVYIKCDNSFITIYCTCLLWIAYLFALVLLFYWVKAIVSWIKGD